MLTFRKTHSDLIMCRSLSMAPFRVRSSMVTSDWPPFINLNLGGTALTSSVWPRRLRIGRIRFACPDERLRLAGDEGDLHPGVRQQDSGRVGTHLRRHRRLRDARADAWRGELAPPQPAKGILSAGCTGRGEPTSGSTLIAVARGALPLSGPLHRGAHAARAAGLWLRARRDRTDGSGRYRGM